MKIAVASEGKHVTEHFGHCEGFTIFEVQGDEVLNQKFVPNPGHRPGFLPVFLYEQGVKVIISGGMGGGAVDIFHQKGIEVILGASGNVKTAVEDFLQGKLKSTGSICHNHSHEHDHPHEHTPKKQIRLTKEESFEKIGERE